MTIALKTPRTGPRFVRTARFPVMTDEQRAAYLHSLTCRACYEPIQTTCPDCGWGMVNADEHECHATKPEAGADDWQGECAE